MMAWPALTEIWLKVMARTRCENSSSSLTTPPAASTFPTPHVASSAPTELMLRHVHTSPGSAEAMVEAEAEAASKQR